MHIVPVQLAIVGAGLGVLLAQPPSQGRMLLIPAGGDAAAAARLAGDGGARLVAAGPLPGSLVVEADRSQLGWPLIERGVLVVAAGAAGCGTAVTA